MNGKWLARRERRLFRRADDADTNALDLGVEKTFTVWQGHQLVVRMNVFNALDSNTVLSNIRQSESSFSLPSGIMPPGIAEFSASYTF
jgi:hypothetical protein